VNCADVQPRLSAHLDGEAAEPDAVCAHLEGCEACREQLEALRLPGDLVRGAFRASPGLAARVAEQVAGQAREQPVERREPALSPWPAGRARLVVTLTALAAGLLLAAGATWWLAGSGGGETPGRVDVVDGATAWVAAGSLDLERGGEALAAGAGARLEPGDVLTAPRAVELGMINGARVSLDAGSQCTVGVGRELTLERGRVSCEVRPGSGAFAIHTELGTARVVGTRFRVALLARGEQGPMTNGQALIMGSGALLAVTVSAGVVLLSSSDGEEREVRAGQIGLADGQGGIDVEDAVALRDRVSEQESQLAAANARVRELEALLGVEHEPLPGDPSAPESGPQDPKDGWDDDEGWGGKKKKELPPLGLPEGMTQWEQDEQVRALVEAMDWETSVAAMRAIRVERSGGRSLSLEEKETLGAFFEALNELRQIGVGFYDPRVARWFVPEYVSGALGADLDAQQAEQLAAFVARTGERDRANPEPEPALPHRFAHTAAQDVRRTRDLELELQRLLRPEQLEAYLADVGDDPFSSGLATKSNRISCPGDTVPEVADQVARLWTNTYKLPPEFAPQVAAAAERFASGGLALPPLAADRDAFAGRQARLERAIQLLELQAEAEHQMLLSLPVSDEDERAARFTGRCPIIELDR
jgi:FecR protein/Putative zinc-finger